MGLILISIHPITLNLGSHIPSTTPTPTKTLPSRRISLRIQNIFQLILPPTSTIISPTPKLPLPNPKLTTKIYLHFWKIKLHRSRGPCMLVNLNSNPSTNYQRKNHKSIIPTSMTSKKEPPEWPKLILPKWEAVTSNQQSKPTKYQPSSTKKRKSNNLLRRFPTLRKHKGHSHQNN